MCVYICMYAWIYPALYHLSSPSLFLSSITIHLSINYLFCIHLPGYHLLTLFLCASSLTHSLAHSHFLFFCISSSTSWQRKPRVYLLIDYYTCKEPYLLLITQGPSTGRLGAPPSQEPTSNVIPAPQPDSSWWPLLNITSPHPLRFWVSRLQPPILPPRWDTCPPVSLLLGHV